MIGHERDLMLAEWIREGHDQGSPEALARALSATRAVRQRPGWAFWRNWLPRAAADLEIWVPRPSVGILLLVAMLVLLALLAVYVGSSPPAPRLPSSIGPAANRLIAFSEEGAINVAHLDGSNRRVLSGEATDARHPVFSPAGTHVAFLSSLSPTGFGKLFVAPVDGSDGAVEVSQGLDVLGGDVPQFSWSPDGSRIAVSAVDDGVATVYLAASDGSGTTPLTDGTIDSDLPSWSLDGIWIAYRVARRTACVDACRQRGRTAPRHRKWPPSSPSTAVCPGCCGRLGTSAMMTTTASCPTGRAQDSARHRPRPLTFVPGTTTSSGRKGLVGSSISARHSLQTVCDSPC